MSIHRRQRPGNGRGRLARFLTIQRRGTPAPQTRTLLRRPRLRLSGRQRLYPMLARMRPLGPGPK